MTADVVEQYMKQMKSISPDAKLDTEQTLEEAFPNVNPMIIPMGGRVLIQIRAVKEKVSQAGIYLPEEVKETEKWNTQVGKVIALGPLAFRKRDSMDPWPEGAWCSVGDFVRVPKWGGDRWEIPYTDSHGITGHALFTIFNDHELIGRVTGDPREIKAFV